MRHKRSSCSTSMLWGRGGTESQAYKAHDSAEGELTGWRVWLKEAEDWGGERREGMAKVGLEVKGLGRGKAGK